MIASGEVHVQLKQPAEWLHHGPKNSNAKDVECEVLNDQQTINYQLNNFKIY